MEIPSAVNNVVKTSTIEYWILDDVLYGNIASGATVDAEQVRENEEQRSKILDVNRPIPFILDITKIDKITKEGRKLSSELTDGVSAIALIVSSGLSRVMGNYAIMLNRPKVPVKLFNSEVDARIWARDYRP